MSANLIEQMKGRYHNSRMPRYILYITLFWAISIFLAPLTLEPHTVEGLDANANWIDYKEKWADMAHYNPYAASVYLFGDLNCHQKASRSLTVHDNQQPVCSRDVGIAIGTVIGSLGLFFIIRSPHLFLTFLSLVPGKIRTPLLKHLNPTLAGILVALPFLLPTGIDGFYQLLTNYESTNIIRLITGFFLGILLAWGFGSAFMSLTVPLYDQYYQVPPAAPVTGKAPFSEDTEKETSSVTTNGTKEPRMSKTIEEADESQKSKAIKETNEPQRSKTTKEADEYQLDNATKEPVGQKASEKTEVQK